jgi:hypothetical protein
MFRGAAPLTKNLAPLTTLATPLVTVVEAYEGWWPLSVETLCRALVALEHPLRSTPARELAAHFDPITPEQMSRIRTAAQNAVGDHQIPRKAVDLVTWTEPRTLLG